jgi:hypothetical protein
MLKPVRPARARSAPATGTGRRGSGIHRAAAEGALSRVRRTLAMSARTDATELSKWARSCASSSSSTIDDRPLSSRMQGTPMRCRARRIRHRALGTHGINRRRLLLMASIIAATAAAGASYALEFLRSARISAPPLRVRSMMASSLSGAMNLLTGTPLMVQ